MIFQDQECGDRVEIQKLQVLKSVAELLHSPSPSNPLIKMQLPSGAGMIARAAANRMAIIVLPFGLGLPVAGFELSPDVIRLPVCPHGPDVFLF